MTAQPAANWYLTRRHYSDNLAPSEWDPNRPGLIGTAICNGNITVHDQADLDHRALTWPSFAKKKVADLPECKACVKALAKREGRS